MKKIIFIALLTLIANIYTSYSFSFNEKIAFATLSIVGLGFIFSLFQLSSTHEWNRRNTALLESEKNKTDYLISLKYIYKLKSLDIEHRTYAYSVNEIHLLICKLNDDNTLKDRNSTTLEYDMTDNGILLRGHLFSILNYYEFLATGINNGVFDEKIIKDLHYSIMVRFYNLFITYLLHNREVHSKGAKILEQYMILIENWKREEKDLWSRTKEQFSSNKRGNTDN